MRPYRTRRRSSGLSSLQVITWLAVAIFALLLVFLAWVYFFAPLPDEGSPASAASPTAAGKPGTPQATPALGVIGGPALPPAGATTAVNGVPPSSTTGVIAAPPTTAVAPPAGTVYRSSLYPYSITVPREWTSRAGVKVGSLTVDGFLGPRQGEFTPSVTVYGQKVDPGVDSDAFARANLQSVTAGGAPAQPQPNAEPAGAKASLVTYPATSGELRYNVNQVFFVQQGIGWVVTLSSPSSAGADTGAYLPVLRQMLASFKAD
jgi:hypothetical protein